MKKKIISLAMVFLLAFNSLAFGEIVAGEKNIGGKKLSYVTIDPRTASYDVVTAHGKVQGTQSFSSMVKNSKADAGINANFFTFATGISCGNLVKDSRIIFLDGSEWVNPSFFIDEKGRAHAESFGLSLEVDIETGEDSLSFSSYNVNNNLHKEDRLYVYSKERGSQIELDQGLALVERGGLVESIKPIEETKTVNIPKDGRILFFRGKFLTEEDRSKLEPGQTISYSQVFFDKSQKKETRDYSIDYLVSAHPMLLEDGKIVVKDNAGSRTRSAIGLSPSGEIKMVVQDDVGLVELAENMKALGCRSAVNLDGGGSSALYANGKYLKETDRMISSAFVAYDKSPAKVYGIKDLPGKNYWSRPALEDCLVKGYLEGFDGYLRPRAHITRAELATIVVRKFGLEERADLSDFEDMKKSKWYYKNMSKAVAAGFFQGFDSRLRPEDPISRQEAFTVLARSLELSEDKDYIGGFKDADQVDSWARKGINALIKHGYVNGMANSLKPRSNLSREEFAQILYKMERN